MFHIFKRNRKAKIARETKKLCFSVCLFIEGWQSISYLFYFWRKQFIFGVVDLWSSYFDSWFCYNAFIYKECFPSSSGWQYRYSSLLLCSWRRWWQLSKKMLLAAWWVSHTIYWHLHFGYVIFAWIAIMVSSKPAS